MADKHHVLVTGSAGAIGQAVCRELRARGHRVRGFDRQPTPGLDDAVVGDIADGEATREAMRGTDSVVHLAAATDDADFLDVLLRPNVIGLYRVMDAARRAELRRVVLASSMQAVSGLPRHRPRGTDEGPAPTNHYGLTKAWAEQMGEMYARCYGMSVIAARIGWLPRDAEGVRILLRHRGMKHYLSPGDAGRFFACAVEAEGVRFAVLYACGATPADPPSCDMEPAKRLIGFVPRDAWPEGLTGEMLRVAREEAAASVAS